MDHAALALTAHMAHVYGGMNTLRDLPRGGLAPWQERRAKELMHATLNDEVPLQRVAAECGLSVRHFARAFRQSTGVPPRRWLQQQRIERARGLLRDRALSLTEIAHACGFADHSRFSRAFSATMGMTPGAWRRVNDAARALPGDRSWDARSKPV